MTSKQRRSEQQSFTIGWIGMLFFVAAIILLACSYWVYYQYAEDVRDREYSKLRAIADLKKDQIVSWRAERIADAEINAIGVTQRFVMHWLNDTVDDNLQALLLTRMRRMQEHYNYRNTILATTDGKLIFSLVPELTALDDNTCDLLQRTLAANTTLLGDMTYCPIHDTIFLDVATPVTDISGEVIALFILRVDLLDHLYPLLQTWPTPSPSAETFLVRATDGAVRYLSPLRHTDDDPLTLQFPLSDTDLSAVQAALDHRGLYQGQDYRGKHVLADIRSIPDSPWYMIAKIDMAEVMAEAHQRGRMIVLITLLAILLTAFMALMLNAQQRKNLYKSLYRSERAHRAAQGEIRATLYGIGDGVIATDRVCQVTRMNPVAERLTGWNEKDAVGKPLDTVFRIVDATTRSELRNPAEQVLLKGDIGDLEDNAILISRDGAERPIADSVAPVRDERGAVVGVVLVFRDRTKEQEAQKALQERESFARAILDGIAANICVIDANGDIIAVNQAWESFAAENNAPSDKNTTGIGVNYCSTVRKAIAENAEYAVETLAGIEGLLDKKFPFFSIEYPCHAPDEKRWFLLFATALDSDTGGAVLAHINITARKMAEDALRESEARFRLFYEQAPVPYHALDAEGRILAVNDAWLQTLGYTREALMGSYFVNFLADDGPVLFQEAFEKMKTTGECHGLQLALTAKDNSQVHASFEGRVSHDPKDDNLNSHWVFVNVTERKLLEEQFLHAQKMESVGRLAGGVAHDFNNMLNVILGHAEMAMQHTDADNAIQNDLKQILDAAQRSANLTRQLLAFARKQTVSPVPLQLNEALSNMHRMLQRLIGEDIDLVWKPGHPLWPVKIDPSQLDQILANLAVNARDAIAGSGRLTVETANVTLDETHQTQHPNYAPGDYVKLTVSDTGIGMDAYVRDHIFEPFFTTKGLTKGTGLGLATIYGIVTQNGGFIDVHSAPGKGTAFDIFLPRSETAPKSTTEQAQAPRKASGGTEAVLLVEDEPAILNLAKAVLTKNGYTVTTALSPAEALEIFERHEQPIDILISDVVMPGMNGNELRERIVARCPNIRVLFMSGYTADAIAQQGLLEEGIHFLQKPFMARSLLQKVREVLDEDKDGSH